MRCSGNYEAVCDRRSFLGRCSTCTAGIAAMSMFGLPAVCSSFASAQQNAEKAKIRLIFAYPDPEKPNWPNIGYDFTGRIRELTGKLSQGCPNIEFLPVNVMSGEAQEAEKILQSDNNVDGYIVYLVGCLWGNIPETIATSGKPMIIVDELFAGSGEFLTSYAGMKRKGHKIAAVSSSRFEDVIESVKCFECLKHMQTSTALVVGAEADSVIQLVYGTTMRKVEFREMNDIYRAVEKTEAKKWADRWVSEAEKVIEPPLIEVEKAAAMYLAMVNAMQKYHANAITINCLGGIYSGQMPDAYPCLGFMQLDNDGLVGACEADQRSTVTKMLMSNLTGCPGFISDPVIDTSKNQIIYAHCVAPTKVYGPDGPSNPYHIRDHSEDRKGACNRSLMPIGEQTTTLLFDHHKKQVIIHQGITAENVDDDKACRTKLAVEVQGDIYKLMTYWDEWGWHRVTFYGDHKRKVSTITALLGFDVIEEA
ncbi:MAG: hypothetical protein JXB48_18760 [Candidatus Latescibacteria bacterium]|nr:hypothetical protein [Candidatus Latescibacterota bacterium]